MAMTVESRLREAAERMERDDIIHLGGLQRLLVEAADTIAQRDVELQKAALRRDDLVGKSFDPMVDDQRNEFIRVIRIDGNKQGDK